MAKLRAGVFAFTSCEGCSLVLLSLGDVLLELAGQVDFVNFREASDGHGGEYDLAIIDGAITRPREVDELKGIRARARALVAMGACAVQGGLYFLREYHDPDEAARYVYGEQAGHFGALPVRPVSHYVPVDMNLHGCPVDSRELIEVVRSAVLGKPPNIPDYPICNECRMAENICVFDRGLACMGPVTRAGCGAICPAHNTGCCGCRGMVDRPFIESHRAILRERGMTDEEITAWYREFNGWREMKDAGH